MENSKWSSSGVNGSILIVPSKKDAVSVLLEQTKEKAKLAFHACLTFSVSMRNANVNKSEGLHFEAVLIHRATLTGVWAHKHELSYRYLRGGKIQPMRSELDFALIRRTGEICFVDTKSFAGDSFARSALNAAQLVRAVRYCSFSVPAGFIVHLRGPGLVSFYPGWLIDRAPKGTSFKAEDGRILGGFTTFTLDAVFNEFKATPPSA